jgi:bifunctional ADP-heptose synthase (sugar kinase/adenylyltransferase)
MISDAIIESILERAPELRIGVLGDLFLDRYLDIDETLNEPSLETGLAAYQVTHVRSQPGAAGTIINNLAALGVGGIVPIAIIGDDGEGYELQKALATMPAVELAHIVPRSDRRTPTYTKPMVGRPGHAARELNRLDIKNRTRTPVEVEDLIVRSLDQVWPEIDALILLDQVSEPDSGVVTTRVRNRISELADRQPQMFVLADSRERVHLFRNVSIKPNQREGRDATQLQRGCGRCVFLTCGEAGIQLYLPGHDEPIRAPAFPVAGPIDPVGAGDSASAGITTAVAAGTTFEEAASFGNLIASITIQQIGTTGTATPAQVRAR